MAKWTIDCSLLYRIRASDRTYTIPTESGAAVEIALSTVRREEFDPRIGSGKNVEFLVDRFGWTAYSEVAARVEAPNAQQAIGVFLSALNNLITQVRDLFDVPWMHEVEEDDLFNLTIGSDGAFQTSLGYGRTRGLGSAMIALTESGERRLTGRLARYEPVAPWRVLELDAVEALDTGRYEEAVILAWSALESGCRTALRHLAEERGISPADLYQELTGRARDPLPWSYEEAINRPPRAPSVLSIVRVTARLASVAFEAGALATSAERGYQLRNRIVHNGARLTPTAANEAVASIRWVLQELALPRTVHIGGANVADWVNHFGEMSLPLADLLELNAGRLTLVHADGRGVGIPVSVEVSGRDIIVGLVEGLAERDAAVFTVTTHGSLRPPGEFLPHFFVPASDVPLVHGLLVEEARALNSMLRQFVTLRRIADRWDVSESLRTGLRFYESTPPDFALQINDMRTVTIPAHVAAFGAIAIDADWERCLEGLRAWGDRAARRAQTWVALLRSAATEDEHSLCQVAQTIHSDLLLLDSIHLACPVEQRVFGSRAVEYKEYRGWGR